MTSFIDLILGISNPSKMDTVTARRLAKNLPFLRRSRPSSNNPFSRLPSRSRPSGNSRASATHSVASATDSRAYATSDRPISGSVDLGLPLYDVVFIIDESGSIPLDQFIKGLSAIRLLIGDAKLGSQFAAIKFSNKANLLFNFVSPDQAKTKLLNVPQNGGGTNTQDALKMARRDLFLNPAASGHRQNAHRMAVVVTDGLSNIQRDQTVTQALQLKGIGTRVMVVAMGNYGDSGRKEMKDIASYPSDKNFFVVDDFNAFHQVANMVASI